MAAPVPKHRVVNTSLSKLRKRGYFRNFGSHVTQRRRLVDPLDWKGPLWKGEPDCRTAQTAWGAGSHVWFHRRPPEETQVFHRLAAEGRGVVDGVPAGVQAVLPGRLGGAASPCFWPVGMSSLCSRIWKSQLQQGTGRARGRPA